MVGAYDAETVVEALIALLAQLAVPISVPVNEPLNEPVLIWVELDTNPEGFPIIASQFDAAPLTYEAVNAKLELTA
jgi:hypothetical protein